MFLIQIKSDTNKNRKDKILNQNDTNVINETSLSQKNNLRNKKNKLKIT